MDEALDYDQITERLYIGARPEAYHWFELAAVGITVDVNLQVEGQDRFHKNVPEVYLWLPVPDWYGPNSQTLLTVTRFLRLVIEEERIVYVHCSKGIGRSSAVAAAYLIAEGMTVEQALAFVKGKRSSSKVNETQISHLHEFATLWVARKQNS